MRITMKGWRTCDGDCDGPATKPVSGPDGGAPAALPELGVGQGEGWRMEEDVDRKPCMVTR